MPLYHAQRRARRYLALFFIWRRDLVGQHDPGFVTAPTLARRSLWRRRLVSSISSATCCPDSFPKRYAGCPERSRMGADNKRLALARILSRTMGVMNGSFFTRPRKSNHEYPFESFP